MSNRMLRNRCLIGLIVVALLAGCFQIKTYWWEPDTVRAQGDDDDDGLSGGALAVLLLAVGGAVAEQKVRLSVGSLAAARATPPYAWFFIVRNTRNEVLFRSERIEVPSGEWRFAEFPSALVGTANEPTQVMIQVFVDTQPGERASNYFGSAEIWNPDTAESSTYLKLAFTEVP